MRAATIAVLVVGLSLAGCSRHEQVTQAVSVSPCPCAVKTPTVAPAPVAQASAPHSFHEYRRRRRHEESSEFGYGSGGHVYGPDDEIARDTAFDAPTPRDSDADYWTDGYGRRHPWHRHAHTEHVSDRDRLDPWHGYDPR